MDYSPNRFGRLNKVLTPVLVPIDVVTDVLLIHEKKKGKPKHTHQNLPTQESKRQKHTVDEQRNLGVCFRTFLEKGPSSWVRDHSGCLCLTETSDHRRRGLGWSFFPLNVKKGWWFRLLPLDKCQRLQPTPLFPPTTSFRRPTSCDTD